MTDEFSRRRFVSVAGIVAAGTLAGCSTEVRGEGTTTAEQTPTGETTAATTATTTESSSGGGGVPSEVSSYLSDTSNFDGSLTDETGTDQVTVDVGAKGNGGNFAFSPSVIAISTGTTVSWKWTGKGGAHNVVAGDGTFDSGDPVSEAGTHLEHTFESTGVHTYHCVPHEALGMKGAVVVR
ncbi:MAG: halocyanin domain-containing protein [Haloarculaceae archaeon]